jgi:hypothetical protein
MREDNFSPNIGFMANYPPRVVFSKNRLALLGCDFGCFLEEIELSLIPNANIQD